MIFSTFDPPYILKKKKNIYLNGPSSNVRIVNVPTISFPCRFEFLPDHFINLGNFIFFSAPLDDRFLPPAM